MDELQWLFDLDDDDPDKAILAIARVRGGLRDLGWSPSSPEYCALVVEYFQGIGIPAPQNVNPYALPLCVMQFLADRLEALWEGQNIERLTVEKRVRGELARIGIEETHPRVIRFLEAVGERRGVKLPFLSIGFLTVSELRFFERKLQGVQ